MNALETYLEELYAIRSSGGAPALSNLLNEVGKTLKPRVRCIINIQNAGAGLPDGARYRLFQSSVSRTSSRMPLFPAMNAPAIVSRPLARTGTRHVFVQSP
jgi:hypothetical protein